MNKKIGIISLGCDKNRVDSEALLSLLRSKGYTIETDPKKANIIIINTCAFIEPSRKESIDTFFEMNALRQNGVEKVIVTGCLGELYGKKLYDLLPEADVVCGINYVDLPDAIESSFKGERVFVPHSDKHASICGEQRVVSTPKHYAYLKIADGCNNYCTYCLIPHIRGRYRSETVDTLVKQSENLAKDGVSELILVAQDVTKYGFDLYGKPSLIELLTALTAIDGIKKIRLLYCYPELVTKELLSYISSSEKICKYLDIPLQHADTEILKKMGRKSSYDSLCALFDILAQEFPEISIRSTFITGFPGETEKQHEVVKEFLKKNRLRNVGFFAYSKEDGTPAAKFPNQVHQKTKNRRLKELYALQQHISYEINKQTVGKVLECVIDRDNGSNTYIGRAEFQSPDIDGIVKIKSVKPLEKGEYVKVKITDFEQYDLIGDIV